MKTLKELGVSPAPWKQGDYRGNDDLVFSANRIVAEAAHEDDARLCAAAPDLYEACRRALVHVGKAPSAPEGWEVAAKLRAALEKAGGAE